MHRIKILAIVAVVACSTGCQKIKHTLGISDWEPSETSTAMDGSTLHASRVFKASGNPSQITADISCKQKSKEVAITLSSFEAKVASNGEQNPSEFVVESGSLSGRVKTANADPMKAGLFFGLDKYSNVATWNLATETLIDYGCQAMEHAFQKRGESISEQNRAESCLNRASAIALGKEWSRAPDSDELQVKQFNQGNKLKEFLPVVIELSNSGGKFEMVIPADDKNVNAVVAACDGPRVAFFKSVPPVVKPTADTTTPDASAQPGVEPPEDDVPPAESAAGRDPGQSR